MSISPGLRNVLEILAPTMTLNQMYPKVISQSGLPRSEVQIYLNELESRRLAEEVRPRPSGEDFRLWRIKKQGLEALKDQHLE
jgi:DNA-binding IclR family transcriptional regulator